jgi:hypothetical protein
MGDLIRENSLARFEAAHIDVLEEVHVMLAAEQQAPGREIQRHRWPLARWFSQGQRTDLAA